MKTIISIIACFILFSFCYCERESVTAINSDNAGTGSITFSFKKNNSADGVCKIILALSKAGFTTINDTVSVTNGNTSMVFISSIPLGTWQLNVDGVDNNNAVLYSGQTEVLIQANQTTQVNLTLRPATGSININIQWGNYAGKAVYFTNGENYIKVNNSPLLNNMTDQLTLEAWVKPINQYYNYIINKTGHQYTMELINGLRPAFRFDGLTVDYNDMNDYWGRIVLNTTIPENEWTHLAYSYNSMESNVDIFINGELYQTLYSTGLLQTNTGDLLIGAYLSDNYRLFYKGYIDEVRIWNISRSQSEIQENMACSLEGNEEGLVAYWRFDEIVDNNIVVDKSGNHNNGYIVGELSLADSFAF